MGMLVDTAQESGGGILPNIGRKQVAAARMLVHERRQIVNEPSDENEWTSPGLFLDWMGSLVSEQ